MRHAACGLLRWHHIGETRKSFQFMFLQKCSDFFRRSFGERNSSQKVVESHVSTVLPQMEGLQMACFESLTCGETFRRPVCVIIFEEFFGVVFGILCARELFDNIFSGTLEISRAGTFFCTL